MPTVNAYLNHGRWVADCACNGAESVRPDQNMKCGSCGVVSEVKFPDPKDIEEAKRLLSKRPPARQNWNHHKGEPVDALLIENIEHGLEAI